MLTRRKTAKLRKKGQSKTAPAPEPRPKPKQRISPEPPVEEEPVAEEAFSMDWEGTFETEYPPSAELPEIPEIGAAKSGRSPFAIERTMIRDMVTRWWLAKPTIIDDETGYVKMRVVCTAVRLLRELTGREFPVLILTTSSSLVKWRNELLDWGDTRVVIFGNSKAERKLVNNESLFFVPDSPKNFDVMLVSREQFVRDSSSLPALMWSAMFIDDLTPSKALYSQSLVGLSDVRMMFLVFLTSRIEAMSEQDLRTIKTVMSVEDIEECVIRMRIEDAVAGRMVEEKVMMCPMTSQQVKASQEQFLRHRDQLVKCTSEKRCAGLVCQIVRQLRLIATHRALRDGENLLPQENPSGKFRQLIKILGSYKSAGRKVAVFCSDVKEIALVHALLQSAGMSHGILEAPAKQKQEKLAKSFNTTDGFAVLVSVAVCAKSMIPLINADTLIALDLEFVPLDALSEIVNWYHRSQFYPEIIRLIADTSIERIMFESYWATDKNLPPTDMENGLDKPDCALALTCLMKAARVIFGSDKASEATVVLKYCSNEPLSDKDIDVPENLWDLVMPQVTKAVKGRPVTEKQFWDEEKVDQLYDLLWDFGWNRWDKFDCFGRKKKEVETVSLVFIKKFFVDPRQYPKLREALGSDLQSAEVKKYQNLLPAVAEKAAQVNGKTFLKNLESLIGLTNIHPRTPADINLEASDLPEMGEGWTLDDDKTLLFLVYVNGLTKIPVDFHPEVKRDDLLGRASLLLSHLSLRRPAAVPPKVEQAPKKMGLVDHQKIISNLMTFGYPNLATFKQHFDISLTDEALEKYVECVFNYCYASVEERKRLLPTLVDKLPKYTAQKIPQRRDLFEKIRRDQTDFLNFSGEDIEFLTAVSFHGMGNAYMSPILSVSCLGSCSEAKLYMRLKVVLQEDQAIRANQKLPENFQDRMPLRINDMLMLQKLGRIDTREGFHNDRYIYPIGYKCCCVCPSPTAKDPLMWVECTISEKNDAPVFTVKPWKGDSWRLSGATPDEPFAELRARLMKKTHKFVPPIDGHEMFGLTSAFVNRLFLDMPGCDDCVQYRKRYFRHPISLVNDWPTIGHFESSSERQSQIPKAIKEAIAKKQKKKKPNDELVPLRLNFGPLFHTPPAPEHPIVDVRTRHTNMRSIVDRYETLDLGHLEEYFAK